MLVRIVDVKQCRNKAAANFILRGHRRALITISLKQNVLLAEYAVSLLHELLHLWVTMLRLKRYQVTNRREHRFINAVEAVVITLARKYMRKKP